MQKSIIKEIQKKHIFGCIYIIIIIIFYLPYLHNTKNLFTAVIARRRGDPGSHRAYGRATSLTLINKVKKKCCESVAKPIQ